MTHITHIDALEKARSYCAYQERSQQEVVKKLKSFQLNQDEMDYVLLLLIQGNYLNEERFAQAYTSGKYRIKKWGRKKIKLKLKEKQISDYCIQKGMEEIEDDVYFENLVYLAKKRLETSKETKTYLRKQKAAAYLYGRGYESELIWEVLNDLEGE